MESIHSRILAILIALFCSFSAVAQSEYDIVKDGVALQTIPVGAAWTQGDGVLVNSGKDNYLYADMVIGKGDFTVKATVTLINQATSAASFVINDLMANDNNKNNFGFAGGSGVMFYEGAFFGVSSATMLGDPATQDGVPFEFVMQRTGSQLSFQIDGQELYSQEMEGNRYLMIGFRPWRSTMSIRNFSIQGENLSTPLEEKMNFVKEGMPSDVTEVGDAWYAQSGTWENYGQNNYLYGNRVLAGTSFHVKANLQLLDLESGAAAFVVNGDSLFEFSNSAGELYVEGPLFTASASLGTSTLEEETPFLFELVRDGTELAFLVNHTIVYSTTYTPDVFGVIGFRPWDSFMGIVNFSVEPLEEALQEPPEVNRSILGDNSLPLFEEGRTITGITLTTSIPEGKSASATIRETLPDNCTIENIHSSQGTTSVSGNVLVWQLTQAMEDAVLTYDLVPSTDATKIFLSGEVQTGDLKTNINGVSAFYLCASENQEIAIVQNGALNQYYNMTGGDWLANSGYMENTGTNKFLYTDIALYQLDYDVKASLTMFGMSTSAASITLQDVLTEKISNFGFVGGSGQMFVEGTFFDLSSTLSLGDTILTEGTPFEFEMKCRADQYQFLIDGQVIYETTLADRNPIRIGLRPWRSRMQVTKFAITTYPSTPVNEWPVY